MDEPTTQFSYSVLTSPDEPTAIQIYRTVGDHPAPIGKLMEVREGPYYVYRSDDELTRALGQDVPYEISDDAPIPVWTAFRYVRRQLEKREGEQA